jgi:hypothetical protein
VSVEQFVLFDLACLPTVSEVQAVARRLGYDLNPEPFDWHSHAGFLPIKLDGIDTGFELYLDSLAGTDDLPEDIEPAWTHSCGSRTGSDLHEALAAMIFMRAFVECTGGGYWYPDDQIYCAHDNAAPYLDDAIAAFKRFMSRAKR